MAVDKAAGRRMQKVRKSDRTRAAILDAAQKLFAEHGHERTTVREIAAKASVDPALVIRYFGSKDELFVRAAAFRNSNRMFCPSIYPRSRSPCRNSRQNSSGLILPITRAPMVGTFRCCASAASGHAAAAPLRVSRNSRRRM